MPKVRLKEALLFFFRICTHQLFIGVRAHENTGNTDDRKKIREKRKKRRQRHVKKENEGKTTKKCHSLWCVHCLWPWLVSIPRRAVNAQNSWMTSLHGIARCARDDVHTLCRHHCTIVETAPLAMVVDVSVCKAFDQIVHGNT